MFIKNLIVYASLLAGVAPSSAFVGFPKERTSTISAAGKSRTRQTGAVIK